MIQGHKKLFLCIIAFLVSIRVSAYDFQIDGFYYNIISNNQVEVTSGDAKYSGQLSIPGSITYNGVSYTVTRIGKSAFRECANLTDVSVSKEIKLIDSHAFRDCSSLRSVTMQDGVKEISTSAFSGCSYLESLTLSNSITKIGDFAFFNCSNLSSLSLPEQLVTIGKSVFSGCSGLNSISLPDNVSTIGDHAFGDCLEITEITIPQNTTSVGSELFSGCNNLVSINVDSRNTVYDSRDNCNAIIETQSNTLVNGCKSTMIPNSVTRIGYAAFSNNKSLSAITIPKSITSIGSSAFVGCTNLRSVISEIKVPFEISSNVFPSDAYSKGTLTVPIGTIEAYKSTNYWNSFSNIVEKSGVEINETNFPDANFRNWVLRKVSGANDGWLTDSEIAEVKSIDCSGNNIIALQGIELFTSLTYLNCRSNLLTSLDVSKNTALTSLDCTWNQLSSLDLSKNTALTELICKSNNLTSLDVSKNSNLTRLDCQANQLTSLNVSECSALTVIVTSYNQLVSLDVSNNTALTSLWCDSNQLISLDVSKNTALTELICGFNQLASLDVSKNTALNILTCESNQLISLDVSKNTSLYQLWCNQNQLMALDLSNNNIWYANISSQTLSLRAVDISMGIAIPVPSEFNISKVSSLKLDGTSVSGSITTVNGQKYLVFAQTGTSASSINGKKLTYNYSTGNSYSNAASMDVTVTLSYTTATTYTLSIQSGSGGSVSYDGTTISNTIKSFSVTAGSSATITITPNSGYRLSKLTVNGTDRTSYVSNNKYTINNISADTNVLITFEQIPATTYTLSIQSGSGGSVSYNGTTISNTTKSFSVESGSSATISITPNSGYRLSRLVVNSVDRTSNVSNNKYTISNITANTTVAVTFEQIPVTTYTLSIQSGSGGSVSYDGTTISNTTKSFSVESGSSATITITPNSGYRLSRLVVNSTDRTSNVSNNKYTVSNITANTTVAVTFEQIPVTTYTLSIQSGSGGSVSYNGTTISNATKSFSVESGSSATISISPNTGYKLSKLTVNGTDRTSFVSNNQYTISNITANINLVVTYETITYTLSIQSSSGGSVSYNGTAISNTTKSFSVAHGSSAAISITPNSGYRLSRLVVNSTDQTSKVSNNQYTVGNITANTTVVVTFEQIPIPTYTLTVTASGNGSATYNGTTVRKGSQSFSLEEGSSATIAFTPDEWHQLGSVKVNNADVTSSIADNQYTVSNIKSNTMVTVTFTEIEYSSLTSEGVNYRVVSNPNKTVSVASGSYGYWIDVPATFTANGFEWSVTGIDKDVISGNPQLAAIIWNPAVQFSASVNNPNFLLYVTSSQYAPSSIKNVVIGNTANSITLTDASSGNNFYCPREFTARSISYSHSYGMTTGINEARGWESIALPFDVEAITHSSKGNLVPFGRWQEGSNDKPFWLCELGSSGFVAASSIKANTPYIISMPNNAEYKDEYRVAGTITFSSTDVKVKSSESLQNGSYSDKTFVPNFINHDANSGFYVLNAANSYVTNTSSYADGSRFIKNLRAVHPFEAYIASANNAKESFPILEDTPTWIQLIENSKLIMDRVYNLSGQQVKVEGNQNYGSLQKGIYIVNGKKIVIR